jgi:serine/threonine protein kinase
MPVPTTTSGLLDLVARSGVASSDRLDAFLAEPADAAADESPDKTAKHLIAAGLITSFHARELLGGKHRGFWIKKYLVLEPLGSGGMGSVYLCEHSAMNRLVAIKVLAGAKQPGNVARFYREARAVAALDHPNIVRAIDVDEEQRFHYLVMEFVDGIDLHHLAQKTGPLSIARACNYIAQAAHGLQHAHDAGWVHRDIKPGNLVIDRAGTLKILDLGLARFERDPSDQLTRQFDENNVLGTADYLAPELTRPDTTVDWRADFYSLGATFHFLLSGKPPFPTGHILQVMLAHQMSDPEPLEKLRPEVPPELAKVVRTMMAKRPDKRPQSGQEVIDMLAPWLSGESIPASDEEAPRYCTRVRQYLQQAPPRTPANRPKPNLAPSRRRHRLTWRPLVVTAALLLLVACVGAALYLRHGPDVRDNDKSKRSTVAAIVDEIVTPAEAVERLHKRVTVRFVVQSAGVSKNQKMLFLNTEADFKADSNFTIVIQNIDAKETDPSTLASSYVGKRVEATGVVTLYNERPQIVVATCQYVRQVD